MVVPYNPCGYAVEWARRTYSTKCHFFADSDHEEEIIWYPAKPDAAPLPFPSAICSLDWDREEHDLGVYTGYKVGEVPGAARPFRDEDVKPRARADHFCGTREDFEDGAVYNPDLAPVVYGADDLPACCAPFGGVMLGGHVAIFPQGGVGLFGSASPYPGGSGVYPGTPQPGPDVWVYYASLVYPSGTLPFSEDWHSPALVGGTYTLETDTPDLPAGSTSALYFWFVLDSGGGSVSNGAEFAPAAPLALTVPAGGSVFVRWFGRYLPDLRTLFFSFILHSP